MKKIQTLLFVFTYPLFCFSQVNDINFNYQTINFSNPPRTNINPMSIKLWDNYNNGGPTSYGTVFEIYGLGGHQTSQLYFGGWDNSKIRYREAFYGQNTWNDWITMLDSKNDVESTGNLKITGNTNSYILTGNVGIGTANPSVKLDVKGTIRSYETTALGANINSFQLINERGGSVGGNSVMNRLWFLRDNPSDNWHSSRLHDGVSVDVSFGTPHVDTQTWWERDPKDNIQSWGNAGETYLTINLGNVGIGTTTPDAKLAVNGNIHAKEVKIDLSVPAPDYVFANGYKLKTLQEVEEFIKKNNHLPEIPSAAAFEKNGIRLAEMNMSLLKKIEEMTLYMIEQNKKINDLEKKMEKIKPVSK
jgi:hypothetical protein